MQYFCLRNLLPRYLLIENRLWGSPCVLTCIQIKFLFVFHLFDLNAYNTIVHYKQILHFDHQPMLSAFNSWYIQAEMYFYAMVR